MFGTDMSLSTGDSVFDSVADVLGAFARGVITFLLLIGPQRDQRGSSHSRSVRGEIKALCWRRLTLGRTLVPRRSLSVSEFRESVDARHSAASGVTR